jgi:hypothetical protein
VWAVAEFGRYRRPAVGDGNGVHRYHDRPTPGVARWGGGAGAAVHHYPSQTLDDWLR